MKQEEDTMGEREKGWGKIFREKENMVREMKIIKKLGD